MTAEERREGVSAADAALNGAGLVAREGQGPEKSGGEGRVGARDEGAGVGEGGPSMQSAHESGGSDGAGRDEGGPEAVDDSKGQIMQVTVPDGTGLT